MNKILLSIAAIGALSYSAGITAFADSTTTPTGTLAGISSVMILVHQGTAALDGKGLSTADLTALVTDTLNAGGIKVVTPAAADANTGGLIVSLNALQAPKNDAYFVSLLVDFHQPVKLLRKQTMLADATTWHRSEIAYVPTPSISDLKSTVASEVGDFVSDYKSANKPASSSTQNGDMQGPAADAPHSPRVPNVPH